MKEKDKHTRSKRDSDRHGRRPINRQGMRDQTDGQGESAKIGPSTNVRSESRERPSSSDMTNGSVAVLWHFIASHYFLQSYLLQPVRRREIPTTCCTNNSDCKVLLAMLNNYRINLSIINRNESTASATCSKTNSK